VEVTVKICSLFAEEEADEMSKAVDCDSKVGEVSIDELNLDVESMLKTSVDNIVI
jgi:hypothetical protein